MSLDQKREAVRHLVKDETMPVSVAREVVDLPRRGFWTRFGVRPGMGSEYNEERSHDRLNDLTPLEYRLRYEAQQAAVSTN